MPLIILSGLPTSGKSTRAQQLYDYLADRIAQQSTPSVEGGLPGAASRGTAPQYRLHLVSDDSLSISRTVYDLSPPALPAHTRSANASEKDARAALYGAVKRVLSPRDIVVLDGLNYIKGWRYQLSCEAKNVRTPHAVLQIGCSVEQARKVNAKRLEQEGHPSSETDGAKPYAQANWDNLVFRYEEPNGMTRWDSPLFVLTWDDDEARARVVFGQIWDAVAGDGPRKDVRPNMVAVQRGNDGGGDYLYVLDRETQDVVRRVVAYQQEHQDGEGGIVPIPADKDLLVHLPGNQVSLAQLQRLRRAFLGLNRGGIGLEGASKLAGPRIRQSFVDYLNDVFEKEL
ncbi:RNA polymerase 2 elongator complex subunit [Grosmannia clavigera kw1407]|uniref:RNA polymerase 2 elongator complex subunit n=1 Tax=Grosmannia clavigera (strain kw1407 / UAMH 11150) TaxID=655863 RepID=F0XAC6_GROCL|nr:RNA polymerase 2 elongator complex subunit [Grosmannia clavigera kw1407]EFX05679.1 RNA polymerase 2 elongator complex subunit [Grosmannia clavigera kw1407]